MKPSIFIMALSGAGLLGVAWLSVTMPSVGWDICLGIWGLSWIGWTAFALWEELDADF